MGTKSINIKGHYYNVNTDSDGNITSILDSPSIFSSRTDEEKIQEQNKELIKRQNEQNKLLAEQNKLLEEQTRQAERLREEERNRIIEEEANERAEAFALAESVRKNKLVNEEIDYINSIKDDKENNDYKYKLFYEATGLSRDDFDFVMAIPIKWRRRYMNKEFNKCEFDSIRLMTDKQYEFWKEKKELIKNYDCFE